MRLPASEHGSRLPVSGTAIDGCVFRQPESGGRKALFSLWKLCEINLVGVVFSRGFCEGRIGKNFGFGGTPSPYLLNTLTGAGSAKMACKILSA